MTAATEYVTMPVEEFEDLAQNAAESVRLEFIGGRVGVKAMADGDHDEIVQWLQEVCAEARPGYWLYPERGLAVEAYRRGRAHPDGTFTPKGSFRGQGEWADPSAVLMLVEVTSSDPDTDRRDREDKPRAYAETGIPVYLLVDRDSAETIVHCEPADGVYTTIVKRPFGKAVRLPDPVGFTIDTEPLREWGL